MGDEAASRSRYEYWFPLVLLGFGLLGLLGWDSVRQPQDFGWFAYAPLSSDADYTDYLVEGNTQMTVYAGSSQSSGVGGASPRDWPWAVLITATFVAAVAWYARRARRAGGSVRAHVALAVGGAIAVPACYVAAGTADAIGDPAALVPAVGLPLLGLGGLAGAWAYFRRGAWRRTAAVVSVGSLVVGVGAVLGSWSPGLLDPVLIATGLLVLAGYERSRLLAVLAGTVLVALVAFPEGALSMLVPAVLVLATAITALVRRGGTVAAA